MYLKENRVGYNNDMLLAWVQPSQAPGPQRAFTSPAPSTVNSVVIVFSKNVLLDGNSSSWTVTVNGAVYTITSADQGNPNEAVMSVTPAIVYGDIVTVAYGGTGTMTDANLVSVPAFRAYPVVNILPQPFPVPISGTVADVSLIDLTFDNPVILSDGVPTGWSVKVNGVNSVIATLAPVSELSTDVVITLQTNPAIASGDTVTVSYNSAIGTMLDQYGVPVQSFTDFPVDNNL